MNRIEIGGKLLLVVVSLAVTALAIEVSFWLLARSAQIYPLVYYQTDDPNLDLWCYDEHFVGTPDRDLRRAHPYGQLTYLGNANDDSTLANIAPIKVPNAIEMRRNEEATARAADGRIRRAKCQNRLGDRRFLWLWAGSPGRGALFAYLGASIESGSVQRSAISYSTPVCRA